MADHKDYLCVGGPLDGRSIAILHGNRFIVAGDSQTEYQQETFRGLDGEVSIWVPVGQPQLETMQKLVQGYAPARSKQ